MVEWTNTVSQEPVARREPEAGGTSTRLARFGTGLLLNSLFISGVMTLLATTLYGYYLVHEHTTAFDRFTHAGQMQQTALQLTAAIVTLDHAERRFIDSGRDDEFNDLHATFHATVSQVAKALAVENQPAMRHDINQLMEGLNVHHAIISVGIHQPEARGDHALFSSLNPEVLYTPISAITAFAEQSSTTASADFSDTSAKMNLAVAGANASMLICGVALFFLHRRRVNALAAQQEDLTVANIRLQSDADQNSTKLERTETLLKSSLSATNVTMFIQNVDLLCSWVHNTQAGISADLIGKSDEDFLPPEAARHTIKLKKEVLATGIGQQVEMSYTLQGKLMHKWMQIDPIFDHGHVIGLTGMVMDITERRSREIKFEAMAHELVHRSQNLVTVIAAMTRSMSGTSHSLAEFEHRLTSRLQAISSSIEVIIKEDWQGASVKALMKAQAAMLDPAILDHISLPDLDTIAPPQCAEVLGNAIHELAQNALQHGALSLAHGKVTVDWWVETDLFGKSSFLFIWQEDDGTFEIPVLNEKRFGLKMLESTIPQLLGGFAELSPQAGGIKWRMRCPWPSASAFVMEKRELVHL